MPRPAPRKLEDRGKRWAGDEDEIARLKVDIERFATTHPDFVPIQVEARALEWARLSGGLGVVIGSKSSLPLFFELQKMAPTIRSPIFTRPGPIFIRATSKVRSLR